jgi:hypothetical protein
MGRTLNLKAGEWVRVKRKDEILATLDGDGRLAGLPFMPEMLACCGRRFQVSKRAHKTCDPPNGLGGRRLDDAVHLDDLRCDGSAHGGCQAGCLMFWKEAWLERADASQAADGDAFHAPQTVAPAGACTEEALRHAACVMEDDAGARTPRYTCQSTELRRATRPLHAFDVRQYAEDYMSGNASLGRIAGALVYSAYRTIAESGIGFGTAMRWAYDRAQKLRDRPPYPSRRGKIALGDPTPRARLDLRPGERVRVRSYPEILETVNEEGMNRGLFFDAEAVVFCGNTYEVLRRVERIIDERTGHMRQLSSDAIVLKDVVCEARYAKCRKLCPRAIYPYWREIWLERVAGGGAAGPPGTASRPETGA